jgi:hypothetical protein
MRLNDKLNSQILTITMKPQPIHVETLRECLLNMLYFSFSTSKIYKPFFLSNIFFLKNSKWRPYSMRELLEKYAKEIATLNMGAILNFLQKKIFYKSKVFR